METPCFHISQQTQVNDDLQIAIMMQSDEDPLTAQKDSSHILVSSRIEHQIFVREGNQQRTMTEKHLSQDEPNSFYYLKTQGYLLAISRVNPMLRYDKIDLTTHRETFIVYQKRPNQALLCKNHPSQAFVAERFIPSKDGSWITHFYSLACFEAKVEFSDVQTLEVKETPVIPIQKVNELTWKEDGWELYFVITPHAWKVNVY